MLGLSRGVRKGGAPCTRARIDDPQPVSAAALLTIRVFDRSESLSMTRRLGPMRPLLRALLVTALAGCGLAWQLEAAAQALPLPGEYRVIAGKVDRGTFNGWRLFHTSCHSCHGEGGGGTDMAPNLVERIKQFTPRGFATKVLTSYRIVPSPADGGALDRDAEREAQLEQIMKRERRAHGQVVMPAWDADKDVPPHVLDLYAYLSARADGEIGPGRPKLLSPARRTR